ncbi:hypothetical protein ALQ09_05324 [Pseudomonas viridiflava]|nr:hypothetical protein ALQ09_05324 [Pseudomonas viridiflava]
MFWCFQGNNKYPFKVLKMTYFLFMVCLVTVRPSYASGRRLAKLLLSARFLISHKAKKASTA